MSSWIHPGWVYVGQGDPGSEWGGGGKPAQDGGGGGGATDFGQQKNAAIALQLAAQALLAKVGDLSAQTGAQNSEVEDLKGQLSTLVAQATALVASGASTMGGDYDSLLAAFNNYQSWYEDLASRTKPAPAAPPTVQHTPSGPVAVPAPAAVVAPKPITGWMLATGLGLLAVGALLMFRVVKL
jgi:hypothetical protein